MKARPFAPVPGPDLELRQVWADYDPGVAAVTLSNALATAATKLSLIEWRVLLLAVSAIRKSDAVLHLTSVDVQAYLDVYHPGKKRRSIGKELRDALALLSTRTVTLLGPVERTVPWLEAGSAQYVPASASETGRATFFLRLNPELTPELTQQTGRFVLLPLSKFVKYESKYSAPLRLLLQARGGWLSAFHTELFVDDLRRRLGVEKHRYKSWTDFRRCVLDVAIAELREQHDLDVQLEVLTRARRAHKVRLRGRVLTPPPTATGEPALEQWAAQVARDHHFNGGFETYGEALGWNPVADALQRSLERGRTGDAPVRNMAAYMRTVLDTMMRDGGFAKDDDPDPVTSPPARSEGDQTPPALYVTSIVREEAEHLRELLDGERMAHFERTWEALDQHVQDGIDDAASEAIKEALKFKGKGAEVRIRAERHLHLKKQGLLAYPPELQSFEAFAERFGVLDSLPVNQRAQVLEFARSYFEPW